MKNELKISTISMICVLCASGMSGAYGASSVRSLGGTGTYTSAASASQTGGSAGVARAGSVRVVPSTVKATATKPSGTAATTAGRAATTPRLSLGKYLGGGTAITGTSSSKPSTSNPANPGLSADVSNRLEVLEDKVADLKSANEDLKESMQHKLTGDDYIEIDKDGNVSLIVDNLKEDLIGIDGTDGREVSIQVGTGKDGKEYIQWQYDGDGQWTDLIAIDELKGDGADVDLADYSTTAEMNEAISKALGKETYTKDELDEKLEPVASFEERMEELTTQVTENMQELQAEMENVNVTINNITNEEGLLVIEENSITSVELDNGAVKQVNLSAEVAEQLVGAPEDEPDGMYVLLVTPSGERVWADLVMPDGE